MLDFRKLLLPLDLEEPSLAAIRQAAVLTRHFHSEVVILHTFRPFSAFGAAQGKSLRRCSGGTSSALTRQSGFTNR
jgi:hypothetical protein